VEAHRGGRIAVTVSIKETTVSAGATLVVEHVTGREAFALNEAEHFMIAAECDGQGASLAIVWRDVKTGELHTTRMCTTTAHEGDPQVFGPLAALVAMLAAHVKEGKNFNGAILMNEVATDEMH
jgi:hypothetical protein